MRAFIKKKYEHLKVWAIQLLYKLEDKYFAEDDGGELEFDKWLASINQAIDRILAWWHGNK